MRCWPLYAGFSVLYIKDNNTFWPVGDRSTLLSLPKIEEINIT